MRRPLLVLAAAVAAVGIVIACSQRTEAQQEPPAPPVAPAPPVPLVFASSGDPAFDVWRADFGGRAVAAGRQEAVVRQLLAPLTPDQRIISADRAQAETITRFANYVERRVSPSRVSGGRAARATHAALLDQIEARYGVDRDVILGIWALETNFGRAQMPTTAHSALATLAFEGRRRAYFEAELLALIEIVERGLADGAQLGSSMAGALGQPQFMPSVYLTTAVDWNADGRRDIWGDTGDALASIANYLQTRGWRRDEPVFAEARLPTTYDFALADGAFRPVSAYLAAGAVFAPSATPAAPELEARLFLPEGAGGPALFLFRNYQTIRAYNNADRYALTITLLARAFAEEPGLSAPWPANLEPLTREQTRELQTLLNGLGHSVGAADGMFGENSRRGLQAFQVANGFRPADGFATAQALQAVRAKAAEALPPPGPDPAPAPAAPR